uniref:Poly(A)-specific ribonuclease PARN-like domain-containing protein 1 n=1 Tax=Heterorhabditis bacteriophora TaxID=37862 RepID=A0A1I7XQ76_HETBA
MGNHYIIYLFCLAVDVEFLGLYGENAQQRCTLFDEPHERYKVDVYNVYLFKQGLQHQEYSFSVSSLSFLETHGFDFNKFIGDGVSHVNLDELEQIIQTFKNSYSGIDSFGGKMRSLLSRVHHALNSRLARLRRKSTGSEGAQSRGFESFGINLGRESLNDLQRAAILYKLYSTVPGVRMRIENNMLECDSTRITKRELGTIKDDLLKTIARELMGASEIIMSIIESRLVRYANMVTFSKCRCIILIIQQELFYVNHRSKNFQPVVGHNSFYDLLYLYQYFVADLPESYARFKQAVNIIFPLVIDTKVLADACNKYHNAAFDALTTGQIFVKLAHLIPIPILFLSGLQLGDDPPSRNPGEILAEMTSGEDIIASADTFQKELRMQFGRWRCDTRVEGNIVRIATNTDTTFVYFKMMLLSKHFLIRYMLYLYYQLLTIRLLLLFPHRQWDRTLEKQFSISDSYTSTIEFSPKI